MLLCVKVCSKWSFAVASTYASCGGCPGVPFSSAAMIKSLCDLKVERSMSIRVA